MASPLLLVSATYLFPYLFFRFAFIRVNPRLNGVCADTIKLQASGDYLESSVRAYGETMKNWYSRPVFFVSDAESSIEFFMGKLGFSLDWNHQEEGRAYVCQVSRSGFELILAQDEVKAGNGRVFISLDSEQEEALRREIEEREIEASDSRWGMPIIQILDLDKNELFFSPPS